MHYVVLVIGNMSVEEQLAPYESMSGPIPEPKLEWNWHTLGGRWADFWTLKGSGEPADQALKGDIDFEGMRIEAVESAHIAWERTRILTEGESWEPFETLRSRYSDIEEARQAYWSQPAIRLLDKHYRFRPINDDLALDEEAYVQIELNRACVCGDRYLRDGIATIKAATMPFPEWNKMVENMLEGLPDDILLSIVDYHF